MASALEELILRADLDGLVRHVDDTCAARDWDHLVRVRDDARAAVHTGRQLWPIATLANVRLALWAPPLQAVRALDDTARQFMPGPVSEILAVHHSWDELAPLLEHSHDRSLVAYERALRGDRIDASEQRVLDIDFAPLHWEPSYLVATYNDAGVIEKSPDIEMNWRPCQQRQARALHDDTVSAFARMMDPWTSQSNGTSRCVVVEGQIEEVCGLLFPHQPQYSPLTSSEALQWLTWAASSGGAHGKRRGVATGRSEALWLLSTFAGLADDWTDSMDELGDAIASFEFYAMTQSETPTVGWGFHLVIVDPQEGLSVGFSATDSL